MRKKVTKRLKYLFLENRLTPADGSIPFGLKNDWRKMKKIYNSTIKTERHKILYETIGNLQHI